MKNEKQFNKFVQLLHCIPTIALRTLAKIMSLQGLVGDHNKDCGSNLFSSSTGNVLRSKFVEQH